MKKIVVSTVLLLGLFGFTENIFADGYYKWVDKKGTIYFSNTRNSSVRNRPLRPIEEGIRVLKRAEGKRKVVVVSRGKALRIYGVSETSPR
jgi:hypothetical protein